MTSIQKVRSISIWIFIIPLFSVNICLYTITHIHSILEPGIPINPTFPYLDGGVSISRTVRNFPMYESLPVIERAKVHPLPTSQRGESRHPLPVGCSQRNVHDHQSGYLQDIPGQRDQRTLPTCLCQNGSPCPQILRIFQGVSC